jgi:PRTRC genetic system ThiF family protein
MIVFDPNVQFKTVTVVGVGGTGAQVSRIVGRMLYDMKRRGLHIPDLVLIDPDIIEDKNIGRQLYSSGDIGQNKAQVVSKRLNLGLGLNSVAIPEAVSPDHFDRFDGNLIISCVDNHIARKVLHDWGGRHCLIGGGNHQNSGQVCIGNSGHLDVIEATFRSGESTIRHLPKEGLLFPALLEPEPEVAVDANISCADLLMQGSQDILINDWVATIIGQYVYKLLYRQPIETFLTFVSANAMSVRSIPISASEMKVYLW